MLVCDRHFTLAKVGDNTAGFPRAVFALGRDSSGMQSLGSSAIDHRIIDGLEKVYNGGNGFDLNLTVDQNLRVNRIYSELARLIGSLGMSYGYLQIEMLPEIRQGVKYDYGDNALVVAAAFVRIETDRLCAMIVLHNQPKAYRVARIILYRAARRLASYRLSKKIASLASREGLCILDVEPSMEQVKAATRQISDLVVTWGSQKPWKKGKKRNRGRTS